MKNLHFIETAAHNRERLDKSLQNLTVAILICTTAAAAARLFFWDYTRLAKVRFMTVRYITEVGWPVTIYQYGKIFAIGFTLCYLYLRFKQDLKRPSLGVANEGIFINQQMLYNAFVPWQNIKKAELLGPAESPFIRLTFKNYTNLLKGQPLILKSISKVSFKDNPVLSITKGETVGDIRKIYELINDKTTRNIIYRKKYRNIAV